MRPILSPSFTSSKMKAIFLLMSEVAETFNEYFKTKSQNQLVEVEMRDVLTRYANDIIASVAFGVEVDSLQNKNNEFFLMCQEATDFTGFWKFLKIIGFGLVPKLYEVTSWSHNSFFFSYKAINNILVLIEICKELVNEQLF